MPSRLTTGGREVQPPQTRCRPGKTRKHGYLDCLVSQRQQEDRREYDHGVLTGTFTWWYENGQKQAEGEYLIGVNSGTWTTWHSNGLRESQVTYVDGKPSVLGCDGTRKASWQECEISTSSRPRTPQQVVPRPARNVLPRSAAALKRPPRLVPTPAGQRSSTVRSRPQKGPRESCQHQPATFVRGPQSASRSTQQRD